MSKTVFGIIITSLCLVSISCDNKQANTQMPAFKTPTEVTSWYYKQRSANLYFDEQNRLYGVGQWVRVTPREDEGMALVQKGETSHPDEPYDGSMSVVGVAYGQAVAQVKKKFGEPNAEENLSKGAYRYLGYWSVPAGGENSIESYMGLGFQENRLQSVHMFYRPFQLEPSIRLGSSMEEVKAAWGEPDEIGTGPANLEETQRE